MSRSSGRDRQDAGEAGRDHAKSPIDIREVSTCLCLRVRRTARSLTSLYDAALEPLGLTINQFGLLAQLYGAAEAGRAFLSMGALAERIGMDPTTLNRSLKPLVAGGFVRDVDSEGDRRVRAVSITPKGRAQLVRAVAPWRSVQSRVETALGSRSAEALSALLDRAAGAAVLTSTGSAPVAAEGAAGDEM